MTAVADTADPMMTPPSVGPLRARPAGWLHDLTSVAGRALRAVPRDLTDVIPPVFIALFFFLVNIATLKRLTGSFLLFFPFLFLTTSYVPLAQLSGWLGTVARVNPVTYLLGGLRSLVLDHGLQ